MFMGPLVIRCPFFESAPKLFFFLALYRYSPKSDNGTKYTYQYDCKNFLCNEKNDVQAVVRDFMQYSMKNFLCNEQIKTEAVVRATGFSPFSCFIYRF